MTEEFLTADEVSEIAQVPKEVLISWRRTWNPQYRGTKNGPPTRSSGKSKNPRYPKKEFYEWLAARDQELEIARASFPVYGNNPKNPRPLSER